MKSLAERKKFRAEQRALALETAGATIIDTGISDDDSDEGGSEYANMTVEQLRAAVKKLGGEVPKEKTLRADILEFAENFAAFKAQESAESANTTTATDKPAGWKAGN